MLLHNIMWVHVTSKIIFVITYLLEDEQELSLGMLIRPKRIYNFWCSMLVLHQFYHCFIYVLVCFYKFSGTNILTRCRSASSCFLLFLVSEILHRKYSRKRTGQKPEVLYLSWQHRRPRAESKTTQQGGHTHARRGLALARAWAWCGPPGHRLTPPLRLFNPRHGYTLSTRAQFHENHRRRRHRQP